MHSVTLNLSRPQLSKLRKGRPVQIKARDVGHGVEVMMSEPMVKKIARAHRLGKGCRVCLNQQELQGNGWFTDAVRNVYQGAREVAKDLYQNREAIKDGLVSAVNTARELKSLIKELRGEGMGEQEIEKNLKELGYTQQDLEGAGFGNFAKGFVKGVRQGVRGIRKGVHEANKVARYVPVINAPLAAVESGLQTAEDLDSVVRTVDRAVRGRGAGRGVRSVAMTRRNQVASDRVSGDFWKAIVNPSGAPQPLPFSQRSGAPMSGAGLEL